jgi:predicted CXXCH cytochrome family protein
MNRLLVNLIVFGTLLCVVLAGVALEATVSSADCLSCHEYVLAGGYRHFAAASLDCGFCHMESGTGIGEPAMGYARDTVCYACHADKRASAREEIHSSVSCVTCHSPHSSDYDHQHRGPHNGVCTGSCHGEHDLGTSHPRGDGTFDVNTGCEISCVSTCHSMHSGAEITLLQKSPRELCASCHDDKY